MMIFMVWSEEDIRFRAYGAELRRKRRILGLTQAELAAMIGTSAGTISRIETGKAHPNPPHDDRIASILDQERQARGISLNEWCIGEDRL